MSDSANTNNQHSLQDKIILVTGAGRGIGREAANHFASLGATVILLGKTEKHLNAVYDEIIDKGYPEPVVVKVNLLTLQDQDAEQLADLIFQEFGRLDGLLHNAAMLGVKSPLNEYHSTIFTETLTTNVSSSFVLTKALLPVLEKSENGRILFTTSSVGRQGRAFWGAYAVSKFAVEGLMQTWADELENISTTRVNAINPGATRTQMREEAYPGEHPDTVKPAADLMPYYTYLMSDESQHIHGQSLDLDSHFFSTLN